MNIDVEQKDLCRAYNTLCYPSLPYQKIGVSDNVRSGEAPLNGLRHLPTNDTCGWYIWAGAEIGKESDFFKPVHVFHLSEDLPEVLKFLSLPPGWRFLLAPGYEDVWYDPSLLIE
jgi:hypothetical protein